MNRDAMLAPFAEEELHTFNGQGGKALTYIEDETVMDRLDLGYGPGNWSIQVEPFPYVEGVVKVRMGIRTGDEWVWYEDFGYPNNKGGQELKEAVSDGIRRCGRYLGIARDLYRKETAPAAPPRQAARPTATPPRPHVVDTSVPEADEWLPPADAALADDTVCPEHGAKWIGDGPTDWYHRKADGGYCRHPMNKGKRASAR